MKNKSILKSSKLKESISNKSKEKEKETENQENNDNPEKENQIKENFDKEVSESLEKEKQLKIQKELEKAELNNVIKLLKLEKDKREKNDVRKIKDYLCNHIDYFKNLLEQSEEKLMKLIPLLNYKTFKTNERIMNFGEEGDKCYILLRGVVGIYKPFPITKQLSLREYIEYLVNVRDLEKNMPKFERILNYNSKIDKIKLYEIEFDYTKIPQTTSKINIMLEEERELGQAKAGASFGEMALIKNQPRNASIIALERCGMIYIEKNDYPLTPIDIWS
jgi:CRP-like cAMP-binding protein